MSMELAIVFFGAFITITAAIIKLVPQKRMVSNGIYTGRERREGQERRLASIENSIDKLGSKLDRVVETVEYMRGACTACKANNGAH